MQPEHSNIYCTLWEFIYFHITNVYWSSVKIYLPSYFKEYTFRNLKIVWKNILSFQLIL